MNVLPAVGSRFRILSRGSLERHKRKGVLESGRTGAKQGLQSMDERQAVTRAEDQDSREEAAGSVQGTDASDDAVFDSLSRLFWL
jgi:hypothetical protein